MIDCRATAGLLGRWYDSDLPAGEAQPFEEHLLVCPPCLVESRRLRAALRALRSAVEPAAVAAVAAAEAPAPGADGGRYWKFLAAGGRSPFVGFDWQAMAGAWVTAEVYACRAGDLPHWLHEELWTVELDGVTDAGHQVVARRARAVGRVETWTAGAAHELKLACLARTVGHAVAELASAGLAGEAAALEAAGSAGDHVALRTVAAGCGGSAHRLLFRHAGRLCLYVADAVDYLALPVATLAFIAARAASERTTPAGDERAWQAAWLVDRLAL